jgi:hypothetical protein
MNKEKQTGPYTQDEVKIPGKMILESRPEGDYKVKMIGQTKSGKIVERNYCSCCALDSCKNG